ncbi:bifunctional phosphopantothenoylcysteine decarboxylase/phosphopantothenate--cysteine ligase CoaBC [Fusibacter bizertensis]|uniref:Coenzyme A biosynthesis bifunctional protein CoaBC n=1 Tax=Fusibacter bizertensis TaxID=1488331 RepID=A0ABT6N8D8_9FIRM|nr:bifunctional phosphopantothenoylcysteine decarboxylase/phosphopantothenate--cysteine ligase CoaBC [Fusibacter bizertensis]MDH8676682.1 bifunctional phosphopantothenoylcysteine decarboxylase/phosphopantothenate--cysteine ligase CoaBC [Fusibacter bizertensis]
MLNGKNIVIGVTGGIAAYKAADVVSRLKKQGANVYVIMTEHSTKFIQPLTFQSISQNYVVTDMFEDPKTWDVEHISLAKRADLFLVVPATANIIGKVAGGIADDFLTTTLMATVAPVYFALAMNTKMYENRIMQSNVKKLQEFGYHMILPESGRLACGDVGAGKLADPEFIVQNVVDYFTKSKPLSGKRILITAGPTREAIDPVRYITNHSSGKMGYAIAQVAVDQGADVTLISGPTQLTPPRGLNFIPVTSTREMYDAVMDNLEVDVVIKAAAPSDYKIVNYSEEKIKKTDGQMKMNFEKNPDILKRVGELKTHQVLVGFAAETQNVEAYAKKKLVEKNLDFIVANDVTAKGAGFDVDTNIITIYDKDGSADVYDCMAKSEVAAIILDKVFQKL